MRRTLFAFLLATVLPLAAEACVDETWPREALLRLKAEAFVPAEGVDRYATALKLIGCLASPDPLLRDGVAYEGLSTWLRQKAFDAEQMRELRTRLYERMDTPDKDGFAVPFVALVLSELARTDRIEAWMTDQERADMLAKATAYLRSVRDYRGFEASSGWRHGVAHGADWLMQLALNPKLDVDQLRQLTDAVASQVRAADGHAYVYGESARLARPVLFAARRDIRTDAEWTAWMDNLSAGMADPKLAYQDAAWLAARHNLAAFFSTIYFEADHGGLESLKPLQNAAAAALKAIP
jgi:Protein of unknown function (DUF2785)